jgi:hypothetical protein
MTKSLLRSWIDGANSASWRTTWPNRCSLSQGRDAGITPPKEPHGQFGITGVNYRISRPKFMILCILKKRLSIGRGEGIFPPSYIEFINWEAIGRALKALSRPHQHFMSKHTVGICGVGKWMLRWKEWQSAHCPQCGAKEDAPRVWVCQGRGANDIWDKALLAFVTWCDSVHTDPELTKAMISGLQSWRYGHPINTLTDQNVYCAISQQSDIGWGKLLEGWMAIEWETLQQDFYDRTQSRRMGASWSAMLFQRLWRISRALWKHRNEILHQQENIVTQLQESSLHRTIQRQYVDLSQMSLGSEDGFINQSGVSQRKLL